MAVGEAFLSAFLQVLFDRLAPHHVADLIRGHDIEKELKKLKKTLRKVNAVLDDAENKQYKDEAVKDWLDELNDAAYDAEDVIDEFTTEALRMKLEAKSETSLTQVSTSIFPSLRDLWSEIEPKIKAFTPNTFSSEIISKIDKIAKRFEELAEERFDLGLEEVVARSSSASAFRETSSVLNESFVYGRDDDKGKIINLLLTDKPNCDTEFQVIPIVGMGGVGKTTLAQLVYNDEQVNNHFTMKAWVCVSDEFDVKKITRTILESVTSSIFNFNDLNQLQVGVKEALRGKKFLIVLDDVWNKKYGDWDLLQKPFRGGVTGSAIIVTTRDIEVASNMRTVDDNHVLKHLSEDDCWSVFVQHAFGNRNIDMYLDLAVVGKEILRKCKGLPLAAKSLGGLLRSKQQKYEWENVLNSKIWDLSEQRNDILPVLKLSYYYLPSHLKRCFAYCSIFPKDYEFEENELVLLWMAEGFLQQPSGEMDLENVGHMNFYELVSRSFFQLSSSNKSLFVMHDLTSDLARWVAGKTCFRLEDLSESGEQNEISELARHSSYIRGAFDGVKKFEAFHAVDRLRTFLPLTGVGERTRYLSNNVTSSLLPSLRCLRVLSFSGYHITELPSSISGLKHLRYLDLSSTSISTLPESVCTLYNLQTLILTHSHLKKLPTTMGNLINLRHLNFTPANTIEEMPPQIGNLTSLRKLSGFVVGKDSRSGIGELMNLKHLKGMLLISKLENVTDAEQAGKANLKDKKFLDKLIMAWCSKFDGLRNDKAEEEVLHMLRPQENLKELRIRCYGGIRFPTWIGDPSFSSMTLLILENCERCTTLPPLGKLPLLKDLRIKGMYKVISVGIDFYGEGCSNPFSSLETLSFEDMQKWRDWIPCEIDKQVKVFPQLRVLSIERCPELLGSLPNHLPSLEKLVVCKCERLTVTISSFPRLCRLDISKVQEVVQRSTFGLNSPKCVALCNIAKATCITEGLLQGLAGVEELEIVGCDELHSLVQKEVSLLQHLTLLRRLVIWNCPRFVSLVANVLEEHQWLPYSCRLESLELTGCEKLENLQGLYNLTSLRELSIKWCPRLVSFPEYGLPPMLRQLKIERCSALKSVADVVSVNSCNNKSLEYLYINGCDSLLFIARGQLLPTVKKLEIKFCDSLWSLLIKDEDKKNNSASLLENLYIRSCQSLTSLSSSRRGLPPMLKHLCIESCSRLESIGESLHGNTRLEIIQIECCENLKSFPEGLHNLTSLSVFQVSKCPGLVSFPDGGLPGVNLSTLGISNCEKLRSLPNCIHNLTSLQELKIIRCPGIVSFPAEGFPTNITLLQIIDLNICKLLFKWGLQRLTSLRELLIEGGCMDLVSFPGEDGMMLPNSLIKLTIKKFPNLEYLTSNRFENLTSLEELWIQNLPKLNSFPGGLLPSLLQLHIDDCPRLKPRCKRILGQEWLKISHIPSVYIDGRFIYEPKEEEKE